MTTTTNPEAYGTRSEKREHGINAWRNDLLSKKFKPWQWAGLAFLYVLLMTLAASTLQAIPAAVIIGILTLGAWISAYILAKRNASISALAQLTPIIDMTTFQGQATILRRSTDLLLERLNDKKADPQSILFGMQAVLNAARPIMERAGITPETANAEGYPNWPEIDRTEMPTRPGDFLTVHAMRLDAITHNIMRITQERIAFEETVARLAGEVVPPLRAIEAVIVPEAKAPIPTMEIDGIPA